VANTVETVQNTGWLLTIGFSFQQNTAFYALLLALSDVSHKFEVSKRNINN